MKRNATSKDPAVLRSLISRWRRLWTRLAIRNPRVVRMPLQQMGCRKDQDIVLVLGLRDEVSDDETKRPPPGMAMIVVGCQGVYVDP